MFSAFVGKLFADELKSWLPWLRERLIQRAVSILPKDRRARYGEEWRSHLNDIPGDLSKLFVALSLFRAAYNISDTHSISRFFSRIVALVALLFHGPLLIVVALLVKISSRGPALVTSRTILEDGRLIELLKFRTLRHNPIDLGPYAILHCFPRMTPMTCEEQKQLVRMFRNASPSLIGRFLKWSNLDTLPFLVNAFRGDVSLRDLIPTDSKRFS